MGALGPWQADPVTTAPDVDEGIPYGTRLGQMAEHGGEATAVTFVAEDGSEQTISWNEIDRRSNQVARVLADRGLGVGDSLAVCLRNSIDHLLAGFAAWKVGATVVPVRWDLPAWERNRLLDVLGPARGGGRRPPRPDRRQPVGS